jgi:hypothetical protein
MPTQLTVSISDKLASQLGPWRDRIEEILELGVRQANARISGQFDGVTDVLETLVTLPTAREVLDLRPSAAMRSRIEWLLRKNRDSGLTSDEEREWQQYEFAEHLVRMGKARASLKVGDAGGMDEPDVHLEGIATTRPSEGRIGL